MELCVHQQIPAHYLWNGRRQQFHGTTAKKISTPVTTIKHIHDEKVAVQLKRSFKTGKNNDCTTERDLYTRRILSKST